MSMEIDDMIAVLQAYKEGKPIEFCYEGCTDRWEPIADPNWLFSSCNYRVRPPKPRTFCVKFEGGRIYGHLAVDDGVTNPHPDCFFVREVLEASSVPSA